MQSTDKQVISAGLCIIPRPFRLCTSKHTKAYMYIFRFLRSEFD